MKYDPFIPGPLYKEYSDIALRKIFRHEDKLLRVAILFIGPDSELAQVRDFELRLNKSIELLKFGEDQGGPVRMAIEGNSKEWGEVVYEYFRLVHNTRYEAWWSLLQSFHQLSKDLRSGSIKVRERLAAFKEMRNIQAELDNIEFELFKDEQTKERIAQSALNASLSGYAERYALESP